MRKGMIGLLFASLLGISSVLSGCATEETGSKETVEKAKEGGTLIVARLSDATTLDPIS